MSKREHTEPEWVYSKITTLLSKPILKYTTSKRTSDSQIYKGFNTFARNGIEVAACNPCSRTDRKMELPKNALADVLLKKPGVNKIVIIQRRELLS